MVKQILRDGDYISPGLEAVNPNLHFPNMIVGDVNNCPWIYLRREVPHNWYVDQRQPNVGFLNCDEAHILYNNALQFKGKKALEIGCWMGWSACHLALAGVELDVIDPLLENPAVYESVSTCLNAAGVLDTVNLVAGYSPQKVEELAQQLQQRWSLIFIDGDHEAPAPRNDAILCEKLAEADAMILFHDLASPDVAQGLDYLKEKGWNTMVYQTMQIMGVAWRGNVEPVKHIPDPKVNWQLPSHLHHYAVSSSFQEIDFSEFRELLVKVRPFTVLSDSRLFSLYALTKHVCINDLRGNFVECGTYRGGAAALMAFVIKRYSQSPRTLYAFDTFEGMPAPTEVDRSDGTPANDTGFGVGTLQAPIRENLDRICQLLDVKDIVVPVQGLFAQTLPKYKAQIESIALLHADGDWYESTMDIFNHLYDIVVPDGMIQIDDYGHWEGCRKAIHDFERLHNEKFDLNQIDYTGVWFQKYQMNTPQSRLWHTDLPPETLRSIQNGTMNYSYRGVPNLKNPFDLALYPLLIWHLKPQTIIEIGSFAGGSGLWLGDILTNFGIDGHVYSIDIQKVTDVEHSRVTFLEGDQTALHEILSIDFMQSLKRPLLIIEDGAHFYETTLDVLNFFHPYLQEGEYILVEDGIVSALAGEEAYRGGPSRALREFLSEYEQEYAIDRSYCDFFGHNLTWNISGYLKKVNNSFNAEKILQNLSLREINLVTFPDWVQDQEIIYAELQKVVRAVLTHLHRDHITLLINASRGNVAQADEMLAEVVMRLLMEEDLEFEQEPQISLISELHPLQWQALLPKIQARVELEYEDQAAITSTGAYSLNKWHEPA